MSSPPADPLRVAIVAPLCATASTVYGLHDFFCGIGRDWQVVTGEARGAGGADPPPRPVACSIVAGGSEAFPTSHGSWIQPTDTFERASSPDLALVGDLMVPPGEEPGEDCRPAATCGAWRAPAAEPVPRPGPLAVPAAGSRRGGAPVECLVDALLRRGSGSSAIDRAARARK